MVKNYYDILGIKKSATQEEIRESYIKLAKKFHPDITGDNKKFMDIKEAYQVLSDENERAQYNNSLNNNIPFERQFNNERENSSNDEFIYFQNGKFNQNNNQFQDIFTGQGSFFDDIIKNFFSFNKQEIENIHLNIEIDLKIACYGGKQDIKFKRKKYINDEKYVIENTTLAIVIPPMIENKQKFIIKSAGNIYNNFSSDLEITFSVLEKENFYRKGKDLYQNIEINIFDVLTNKNITVHDLNDKKQTIQLNNEMQNGDIIIKTEYNTKMRYIYKLIFMLPKISYHKEFEQFASLTNFNKKGKVFYIK